MCAQSLKLRRCSVQSIRSYHQLEWRFVIFGCLSLRCRRREPTGVRLRRRRGPDDGSGRRKSCFLRWQAPRPFFSPNPRYYRYPVKHHVRGKWGILICFHMAPCLSIWVMTASSPSPAGGTGESFRNHPPEGSVSGVGAAQEA